MKKLLLLGIPLVTLAGLNAWSQAVAEPAHIRGPGVVVRDGTGPDLAADVREADARAAEIPAAAPATSLAKTTAKNRAKDPAATRAPASGAVREPAPVSPAPLGATGSLDRITVLVPAIPATISTHDASDDDGGSRGRGRGGKSEGSRSGHQGGRDDS
ncbi:hypothetical protein ASG92_00275 [Arthrobacter sp. Soil736]|uniref:hypothetical protein n=1 Tax=Arthrobacter sp. Soil736 TaxID=1736395 RepID=UPI0006FC927A|nr:hypothetical protein [Arthrobacter sp. Soil736]KRE68360.1 hypothetical protein ASG92_00275 [Arthrobacter sp. Soil736]